MGFRRKLVLAIFFLSLLLLAVVVLAARQVVFNRIKHSAYAGNTRTCVNKDLKADAVLGDCIYLETATTPEAQEKGLGGRESLPADKGMEFIFEGSAVRCFWMKDMQFNIDMVWLDASDTILAKEINVSPATFPQSFCPDVNAQKVLEFNANTANDWPIGAVVPFEVISDV